MEPNNTGPSLSPTSLTVADLARLLEKVDSGRVTSAMIKEDLAAGAPTNPDGTINLIHYGAWLARKVDHDN